LFMTHSEGRFKLEVELARSVGRFRNPLVRAARAAFAAHVHPAYGRAIHQVLAAHPAHARAEESRAADFQAGFLAAARPAVPAGSAGLRTDRSASHRHFLQPLLKS
jgi:hypothetical protein